MHTPPPHPTHPTHPTAHHTTPHTTPQARPVPRPQPLHRLLAGALRDASQPLCATNLPAPSETFVGRQVLMSRAVAALLHGRKRYVCLVGAGGIGKTALALAVAHYVRLRCAAPQRRGMCLRPPPNRPSSGPRPPGTPFRTGYTT